MFARRAPRQLTVVAAIAGALVLAGCPPEPVPPPRPPPAVVEPPTPLPEPRPDGRLPGLASPTHYALDLDVDPAEARFRGTVRIDVELPAKTSHVVLHGAGIEVTKAHAIVAAAKGPLASPARSLARIAAGGKVPEELVLSFPAPLPAGRATLVIDYVAPFDDALAGLYRVKDGALWYAFTQFEPTDARRAFPCFDEPAFKVPFDVSITVPKSMIALANAAEVGREDAGAKTRFRFAKTPPLPTYLVAFAVGDFAVQEAPRFARPPVRIVTTKSKGDATSTKLALEAAGDLVDALAAWFGIPYPYEKLDLVAVPDFEAGAMENAGLVTFREEFLLLDPARASSAARREQALTIAHELAHQWFGDLVTASWWNDLWLNEGMATWMETRIVDRWRPALGAGLDAAVATHDAMNVDGLVSARAVRQPVVTTSDAEEAFDAITYEKGAAVLQTIEQWIGEDAFKRGIRAYLEENAWKSVEAKSLFAALDRAAAKDVTQMASAYLDQTGVPDVQTLLECDPGGRWHLTLTPQPWRPLGTKMPEDARSWTIPVCVRARGDKKDTCAELTAGAPSLIAGRGACPGFVHPNWESSYYRFSMSEKELVRLAGARAELDVRARISLLSNAWASVRSGALDAKSMLKVLPLFDDDRARQVVSQVISILGEMSITVVDDPIRPAFRQFVLARLAKRKKALGWAPPKQGDSGDDAMVRASVLRAMGDLAEDEATLREAEEVAVRWLADPAKVDSEIASVAVDLASRRAPDARIGELLGSMQNVKMREDRSVALRALAGFDDPQRLGRALDATLGTEVHPDEMGSILGSAFSRRKARSVGESWVRAHWEELTKKLPGRLGALLVRAAGVGCSDAEAAERTAFYSPRAAKIDGTSRALAGALEEISLCAALHDRGATSLQKALAPKR